MFDRKFGIILPVFSLPSRYGIGSLGQKAFDFIDYLYNSRVGLWQVLPLGPTSYGNSPYQSFSAFAGNEYFIDLELLISDGLLKKEDINKFEDKDESGRIDYGKLYLYRFDILDKAARNFFKHVPADYFSFIENNKKWINDYALFMALKKQFDMIPWLQWPEQYRQKDKNTIDQFLLDNKELIDHFCFCQYEFYKQWTAVRQYANRKKVKIIGDIPFYVSLDSADVWANKQLFMLDATGSPTEVAGVPPDYFSETGQLWGNPIYAWSTRKKEVYEWWGDRVSISNKLFDYLRIDHFRGFDSYWAVPAESDTAINGKWKKGPGIDFIKYIKKASGNMKLIAEDLGLLTPSVRKMLRESRLPGMKVLEFAFSDDETNEYLPDQYPVNCVCYTGTHDNEPLSAWFDSLDKQSRSFFIKYMTKKRLNPDIDGIIRLGMSSKAKMFIVQMQDLLGTGNDSRINSPGVEEGNWQWRVSFTLLDDTLKQRIQFLTSKYNRRT